MAAEDAEHFGSFTSTQWSLVRRAQDTNLIVRREALDELLRRYYPALRAHLVIKRRLDRHRAEDLLQGFITDKVLKRELICQADRSKGRLRSLLLKSLENYAIDWFRAERTKQPSGSVRSLDEENCQPLVASPDNRSDVFELAWARTLLSESFERMRSECESEGRPHIWELFEARILAPNLRDTKPPSYDQLVRKLAFDSPAQASNALVTAKRQFKRVLESVIADDGLDPEQVEDEILELRAILAAGHGQEEEESYRRLLESTSFSESASEDPLTHGSSSGLVAVIVESQGNASEPWSDDELEALFRHQLATRFVSARKSSTPESGAALARRMSSEPSIDTFEDVFADEHPPLDLLREIKGLARASVQIDSGLLPRQLAALFYFGSIATALVRHGARISQSDDQVLSHGFQLMLERPWIGATFSGLFRNAVERLETAQHETA